AASRRGVHEDHCFIAIEKGVSQIDAADAEIGHPHRVVPRPVRKASGHFHAKRIIPKEDIADPGNKQTRGRHLGFPCIGRERRFPFPVLHPGQRSDHTGSTSSTPKKKRWPGCLSLPRSRPGSSSKVTAK